MHRLSWPDPPPLELKPPKLVEGPLEETDPPLPGWYADPSGRSPRRLWDGGQWTPFTWTPGAANPFLTRDNNPTAQTWRENRGTQGGSVRVRDDSGQYDLGYRRRI